MRTKHLSYYPEGPNMPITRDYGPNMRVWSEYYRKKNKSSTALIGGQITNVIYAVMKLQYLKVPFSQCLGRFLGPFLGLDF